MTCKFCRCSTDPKTPDCETREQAMMCAWMSDSDRNGLVASERKKELQGALRLIEGSVKSWLPEIGEVYGVTLTKAQRDALLSARIV